MHSNFFCKSSHLNLYTEPSYKSKISSQILYGEKFRILLKKKKFIKIIEKLKLKCLVGNDNKKYQNSIIKRVDCNIFLSK